MTTQKSPLIHDIATTFHDDTDDKFNIVNTQHIPDDFISDLKKNKMDSARAPIGEMLLMCSIPVSVVEDLLRSGYDVMKEPVAETIKMLKAVGLDAFITTDKQI